MKPYSLLSSTDEGIDADCPNTNALQSARVEAQT